MKDKRIVGFILLFLLAGAAVGYAAIPQNTLRQNAGITMPTVNATGEYYRGALNYSAWIIAQSTAAIPVFDQDLNTTSDVVFTKVTVPNVDSTTITVGATAYLGFNQDRENSTNYFYCTGSSDGVVIQQALNYTGYRGGGVMFFEEGLYGIDDQNVVWHEDYTNESISFIGEGISSHEYTPATGNGTVLHFTGPYTFSDVDHGKTNFGHIIVKNIGFDFSGTFTSQPIRLVIKVPYFENVRITIRGTLANNSVGVQIGSTGPPGEPFIYKNVQFIDSRVYNSGTTNGGNFAYLARLYGEILVIDDCSLIVNTGAGISQPRGFRVNQVTHATIRNFMIFTGTIGSEYEYMWFYGDPEDSSLYFENCEFLLQTDITDTHIRTVNSTMFVRILNAWVPEGSYADPILVSVGTEGAGTGTIYLRGIGRGYDWSGTAELSDDDWLEFPTAFVGTPQVTLTVSESDAKYIAQVKAVNTTHFQLYLYDETAGAPEAVDKTIDYQAWYGEN